VFHDIKEDFIIKQINIKKEAGLFIILLSSTNIISFLVVQVVAFVG
jgi:hypothetical protein